MTRVPRRRVSEFPFHPSRDKGGVCYIFDLTKLDQDGLPALTFSDLLTLFEKSSIDQVKFIDLTRQILALKSDRWVLHIDDLNDLYWADAKTGFYFSVVRGGIFLHLPHDGEGLTEDWEVRYGDDFDTLGGIEFQSVEVALNAWRMYITPLS